MTNALASPHLAQLTSLVAGAQRQLPPGRIVNGSIVRVPADESVGHAYWRGGAIVLVHRDRILGRGPWYMQRSQVELAGPDETAAYQRRCEQMALVTAAWPLA